MIFSHIHYSHAKASFVKELTYVYEMRLVPTGTHLGLERTAENITAQYHWNGIYRFIKQYIRQCKVCVDRNPKMFAKRSSTVAAEDCEETDSGGEGQEEDTSGSKVRYVFIYIVNIVLYI